MARTIGIGLTLYILTSLFFYFGSPSLVQLWVGPGQYVGKTVLILIMVNFLIGGLAVVPGHFVLAAGSNPFALTTLVQGALTVIGVIILCPIVGVAGVPLSSLVAGVCTNYWYSPFKGAQIWKSLGRFPRNSIGIVAEIKAIFSSLDAQERCLPQSCDRGGVLGSG